MKVFISHSSRDKPEVEALARFLRSEGIDAWFDKWEIAPGDDVIARINQGLAEANAGLIVFSAASLESPWVNAEVSSLTHAMIESGQLLIPLQQGADAYIPPLLRARCRLRLDQHGLIADALRSRERNRPPLGQAAASAVEVVRLCLERHPEGAVAVTAHLPGLAPLQLDHPGLPAALLAARAGFLRGFGSGRDLAPRGLASLDADLANLGHQLAAFCLPAGAEPALRDLVDHSAPGTVVEVAIETSDPELLGLPFETLRLADGRLLATQPAVVLLRRGAAPRRPTQPLAGPLKVLVAVGAPDEGSSGAAVLDYERELQTILNAVEPAQRNENVEVRILEVGHAEVIAAAIQQDAYHVLHLSCHGQPGALELEDEDGRAVRTTAADLVGPIRGTGRPLPLVVLNACHGGVESDGGTTASLATALLTAGIPAVLAMQTTVSDRYATELAGAFYKHLTNREPALASRALAAARQELEQLRLQRLANGAPLALNLPEAATAALYLAGDEQPLADFGADKVPLRQRPVHGLAGPVPQLPIGELVGRRQELRRCLQRLRDQCRPGGVVVTGIGGVGKSSVAGRVMQRLKEEGWLLASHVGRLDLGCLAAAVARGLRGAPGPSGQRLAERLRRPDCDDQERLELIEAALSEQPLLLVLDDFEQNLDTGGQAFLDPDGADLLKQLSLNASRGRLLLTCRYPLPGSPAGLDRVAVGPLSEAETRKLVWRLPGLMAQNLPPADMAALLRRIGGHPRILEFLDGLLSQGQGRLPAVSERLDRALAQAGMTPGTGVRDLDEGVRQVVSLGMRDVLLAELLNLARDQGLEDVLLQAAVSGLETPVAGLAWMLERGGASVDETAVQTALQRLESLSLVVRSASGGAWVHRWTAEGLSRLADEALQAPRCRSAGDYRWWKFEQGVGDLADALEAVRNYLQGGHWDSATQVAGTLIQALQAASQTASVAALASEVLACLPEDHGNFLRLADAEAGAHLALGQGQRGFARYQQMLAIAERLAKNEPERADYQRDLSVSYIKIGDLYRDLGQGEAARQAYASSLAIAERLAKNEPERADYQRDLVVSYVKVASAASPPDRPLLEKALGILLALKEQGRLAPADQAMVGALQEMLQGS
ncbi:MAG: CHAT domain-containing protein [Cyanobium sp.]